MDQRTCVLFAVVTWAAACDYPRLAPIAGDADAPCSTCELLAIDTAIAQPGDTIELEGTFANGVSVQFAGGSPQPVMVLGSHRATVTVPQAAISGPVTLSGAASTAGAPYLRVASFQLGLGRFEPTPAQDSHGQQAATMVVARRYFTTVTIGNSIYAIAGQNLNGSLFSVERGSINADGTIGPFAIVSSADDGTLVRDGLTSAYVAGHAYLIGGGNALDTIEQGEFDANGNLVGFTIAGPTLVNGRSFASSAVIGNQLYVIGGNSTNASGQVLSSVESATIGADGSLGAFSVAQGSALMTGRAGGCALVIGDNLYVIGGSNAGPLDSIERATIAPDGTLGAFETVADNHLIERTSSMSCLLVGQTVYIVGGVSSSGNVMASEQATVGADGTLGPMSSVEGSSPSDFTAIALSGLYAYALGGDSTSGPTNTSIRININQSGKLGQFQSMTGDMLPMRDGATSVVLGNYLYVVGGDANDVVGAADPKATVYQSSLGADGSHQPFTLVAGAELVTPRENHTNVIIGSYLYVIGGTGTQTLGSIERAAINTDGTLGAFSTVTSALVTAREGHISLVIGPYLYVIGGSATSVERATINADGSLGAFSTVSGITLTTLRRYATGVVLGSYVYVIGGAQLATVERATINADGSLGAFAVVSGVTLTTPREGHTAAVLGSSLYVVGGQNGEFYASVERAPIAADGTLGSFEVASGVSLAQARAFHTSTVANGYLYILSGLGGFFVTERAALQ